jgi:glycosyltransferase involved in cell wall biosynthesis
LGQDAKKANKYPKLLPPRPGELVALSDFIQNEFWKNHRIKPQFVIPPGIDETLFDGIPREKDIDILGVGSLIPLKQYEIFLEIVAELKKQIPGVKAFLVGKGPEKQRLQSLVNKFELEKNVRMTGELPYDEVLKLMQRAKILLHPSSYEGFSGVCMEALSAGSQVISFCKPMNSNIPRWHIVKNREEMIKETLGILRNPEERYQSLPCYPMKHCVNKIMDLFEGRHWTIEKAG